MSNVMQQPLSFHTHKNVRAIVLSYCCLFEAAARFAPVDCQPHSSPYQPVFPIE